MAMKLFLPFFLGFLLGPLSLAQEKPTETKPPVISPPSPTQDKDDESPPAQIDKGIDQSPLQEDPFAFPSDSSKRLIVPAARGGQKRTALLLRLETWETTALDAIVWQDQSSDSRILAELREELLTGQRPARIVFSPSLALDESTKGIAESISERIYPTEYEPPELPPSNISTQAAAEKSEWVKWLEAAGKYVVPTSFETRNTGQTLEATVQPVVAEENSWDVSLSFDNVESLGNLTHGAKDLRIEMPLFGSFRTGGLIRLKEGQWRLLSVMEPPRGLDGKPSEKRWLTLVRIDPET